MRRHHLLAVLLLCAGGCFYNACDTYVCKAPTDCPLDRAYCCVDGECLPADSVDGGSACR